MSQHLSSAAVVIGALRVNLGEMYIEDHVMMSITKLHTQCKILTLQISCPKKQFLCNFNPFTALPRAVLVMNTASNMPVPRASLMSTRCRLYACFYNDNSQGTELNYPYLLYNKRVNVSKIYTITLRPKACFSQGKRPI